MTSLFASQFHYPGTYDPGSLDTGQIEVGATLPRAKPKGTSPDATGTGTRVGIKALSGAGAASSIAGAASTAGANNANAASGANNVGVQREQAQARQGTLSKLMHMAEPNAGDAPQPVHQGPINPRATGIFGPSAPTHTGGPSLWSTIGHGFGNEFNWLADQAGHMLPIDPAVQKVTPHVQDTHVTEPSRVFNQDPSAFTRPAATGTGRAGAIDMGPYSPQFRASFGHEAARFGQAATQRAAQPSSSSIWDELGKFLEEPVIP